MNVRNVWLETMALNFVWHKWKIRVFYIHECVYYRVLKEKASTTNITICVKGSFCQANKTTYHESCC